MRKLVPLFMLLVLCACNQKAKTDNSTSVLKIEQAGGKPIQDVRYLNDKIAVHSFDTFKSLLSQKNDTTYVVNFWATWCEPCVAEMPYFEQLLSNYQSEPIKVILVNLDMRTMWQNRLLPFLEKKNLSSEVVILDDPRQNKWIPQVEENWGGGIPATLIYRGERRAFYEKSFTYEELEEAFLKIHHNSAKPSTTLSSL